MSGTDYTQTPNLQLYKPIFNADVGNWGMHWNLNADKLDSTLATSGGVFLPLAGGAMTGPLTLAGSPTTALQAATKAYADTMLPLAGGTMTGNLEVGAEVDATTLTTYNHRVQTGGTLNTALGVYGDLSGIQTGGNSCFSRINLVNDTLAAGGAGLTTLLVDQNSGGTGTTGNRVGAYINFHFTGGATNKGLGIGSQYAGQWIYAHASGNVGGTSGSANQWGQLWGAVSSATLESGAMFWNYCVAHEFDFGVSTGASANYVQGIKIVLAHHNQAVVATDYMLGMAKFALTDVGIGNGIAFGSPDGYWPIDSTGTLIGTLASNLPTPPPRQAAHGIDFSLVTFGTDAFLSTGFSVNPTGRVTAADIMNSAGIFYVGGSVGYYVGRASADAIWRFVEGGIENFRVAPDGSTSARSGTQIGGTSGPTWTTGAAAPAATAPIGSLYSRTGGAVGATLYVSRGAGTWAAVAGV